MKGHLVRAQRLALGVPDRLGRWARRVRNEQPVPLDGELSGRAGSSGLPRPEYPRPQFHRPDSWLCLNGVWEFEADHHDTGRRRGLIERPLRGRIVVPFAPESSASGIGHTDFLEVVWYRRSVTVPAAWAGRRVLLHFGAVDHDATVWVGGVEVARHRGGFTPFSAEITDQAKPGEQVEVVVRARDPRRGAQARGKQSVHYANHACFYTRTTGIWQTVWLEAVPQVHLGRAVIVPDLAAGALAVTLPVSSNRPGWSVRVTATERFDPEALVAAGAEVAVAVGPIDRDRSPRLTVPLDGGPGGARTWSPADPHLYGLRLELLDGAGQVVDRVESYAGLRSVTLDGMSVLLNGSRVFQRLVLDQGWWPGTLMTAPSDAALVADLELARSAGFNGSRLHQKVVEERMLFHADRLGHLLWGEFADWGSLVPNPADPTNRLAGHVQRPTATFVTQWAEVLERDRSHPSIIGWCPLNETTEVRGDGLTELDDVTRAMVLVTRAVDPTRPVIDASGWSHREDSTDIYDLHVYDQDPARFAAMVQAAGGAPPADQPPGTGAMNVPWRGQPWFFSEIGGVWWDDTVEHSDADHSRTSSWGYGRRSSDLEAVYQRFEGLTGALLAEPNTFGYCWTQLTDVFQERNGIAHFDRTTKLDPARLRAAQERPAAYELQGPGPIRDARSGHGR